MNTIDLLSQKLSRTQNLWALFVSFILITAAFPVSSSVWDINFIDPISSPELVREAIASMSSSQRHIHAWLTATLDVAYPLVYGALFFGSAYAFFPKYGRYLAIPACLVIPIDLLEGVVQVLALTEVKDALDFKALLTPAKSVLFLLGLAITFSGYLVWLYSRVRRMTS